MTRTFNLADVFETVVNVVPERMAFVMGDTRLTFSQLNARANQLGNALRARGIQRGDNVGIQLYNSPEYVETFFACCKIGAVPVNVNYRYVADELEGLFNSLDLRALVVGDDFDDNVNPVLPHVPTLRHVLRVGAAMEPRQAGPLQPVVAHYESVLAQGSTALSDPERSDDDVLILCTGGTTGLPKGVMWSHKGLFMSALGGGGMFFRRPPVSTVEELETLVPQGHPLACLSIAPLMHGAAMWATLISLFAGHPVYVNEQKSFNAEHIWDLVERYGINVTAMVGDAMGLPLIQALENNPGRWDLRSLITFGSGGAVFSHHLQERMKKIVPHVMFNNSMASSESGTLGGEHKAGEGLMVLPARQDLAVLSDDLRILTQPGEEGVLSRRGYMPMGYYGDRAKTDATFVTVDGSRWVLTGDRARIQDDGSYVVLGRGSQCINTGGEKVFPEEVEEAARRCEAVQDVLVVGVPDERWGSKVVAVVQVQNGKTLDVEQFDAVCRKHLSGYKVPRAVYVAQQVVRSPAGKADYRWAKDYALRNTPVGAVAVA